MQILGYKHNGKARIAILVIFMFIIGLVGMVQPGVALAKTEFSEPATSLAVVLNDNGEVYELATYSIPELEKMPQVQREYSSIDRMPAPVFTAGKGLDLASFLSSQGIDVSSISYCRFYATDNVVKKLDRNVLFDRTGYYFPKIVECWDTDWDKNANRYTDVEKVSAGAAPVKTMLAITSSQGRWLDRPDWSNLDGSTCLRLCLGQITPEECITMNFVRWVYKIEVFGKLRSGVGGSVVAPRVNLEKPSAGQTYPAGDTVEIAGTVEKLSSVTLTITDPDGHVVYTVFDLKVKDGKITEEFPLGTDAVPGNYTIEVGPKAGSSLGCKQTFRVTAAPVASSSDTPKVSEPKPETKPELVTQTVTSLPTSSLNDISNHWAVERINNLVARGAIKGYPDNTFQPDNTITRAEFTTVVVKAFNLTNSNGKVFTDTSGHWAKDYIATATAAGIVGGYNDNVFGPNDPVTREQMAAMVVKAANLTVAAAENQFADSNSIAGWAQEAVATAVNIQIIRGYPDNTFKPGGKATRAEAVTVIVNALNLK